MKPALQIRLGPAARADAATAAGDSAAAAVEHGARAGAQYGDRIQPAARARSRRARTSTPATAETDRRRRIGTPKRRPKPPNRPTRADDGPLDLELERSEYRGTALDEDGLEPQDAEVEDLRDHLLWQLNLTPMSRARPRDRGHDHRSDRRRRLSQRIRRSDPDEPRVDLHGVAPTRSKRAPSRAALRSGRRRQPLAARMPRACSSMRSIQTTPALALARTLVNEHLEALARQDRSAPVPARARDRRGIRYRASR